MNETKAFGKRFMRSCIISLLPLYMTVVTSAGYALFFRGPYKVYILSNSSHAPRPQSWQRGKHCLVYALPRINTTLEWKTFGQWTILTLYNLWQNNRPKWYIPSTHSTVPVFQVLSANHSLLPLWHNHTAIKKPMPSLAIKWKHPDVYQTTGSIEYRGRSVDLSINWLACSYTHRRRPLSAWNSLY